MTQSQVRIQVDPESVPATPSWLAEGAAFAQVLSQTWILKAIQEQVRFARARFGHSDLLDFVVVLIGYALKLRTYPEGILRTAPAVCRGVDGALWSSSLAPSLEPLALSCRP